MSLLIQILLAFLLALLGLLLAVILLPARFKARGVLDEERVAGFAELVWGWGLVSLRVSSPGVEATILGFALPRSLLRGRRKKTRKKKKPWGKGRSSRWLWNSRRVLFRAVARLLATLHLRGSLSGLVGTGDPAQAFWLDQVLSWLDEHLPGIHLNLGVDFIEPRFEIEGDLEARLWPVETLFAAMLLLLDRETRSAIQAAPRARSSPAPDNT